MRKQKPAPGFTGASFRAWIADDGTPFLLTATHHNHQCGCKIEGNATIPHPLKVKFCPLHDNAMRALELLDQVASLAETRLPSDWQAAPSETDHPLNQARELIAQLKGGKR